MNKIRFLFCLSIITLQTVGKVRAQVCYGSTGQPTFTYNFPEGKFTGYTDFSATTTKPFPGAYTFTASATALDENWRNEIATGENRIAVFNVAPAPRILYQETFITLCPSTTYTLRLVGGGLEKNGEQTQLHFMARTASGVTKFDCYTSLVSFVNSEYAISFTTPAIGGDVEVTVTAQAARGSQSWFGLSGIVLANCGPRMRAIADYNANSQNVINVCEGDTKTFHFALETDQDYPDPFYQWQQYDNNSKTWIDIYGAISKTHTYNLITLPTGKYLFRVVSGTKAYQNSPACISYSEPLTLNVFKYPVAVASMAATACEGGLIALKGEGGTTYHWTGPNGFDSFQQNPVIANSTQANAGLYTLTVTQNSCSNSTVIQVNLLPRPLISTGIDQAICKGDQIVLKAGGGVSYEWSPAQGLSNAHIANPTATPLVTTTYTVTGYNALGCKSEAAVTITVNERAVADAGKDKAIYRGESIALNGRIKGATFYWAPADFLSDAHSLNPIANPDKDITYTLNVLPESGCAEATDQVFIKVWAKVIIPNTFTPNADGVNDTWKISGLESYPGATVQVFDRNGSEVYRSLNYVAWDGKRSGRSLSATTYYYLIDLKNGKQLSGPVTILK